MAEQHPYMVPVGGSNPSVLTPGESAIGFAVPVCDTGASYDACGFDSRRLD